MKPKVSQVFIKVIIHAHVMAVKKKPKDNQVPHSYKDAISRPDSHLWLDAMQEEMESHTQNGIWEAIKRLNRQRYIKGQWIYGIKDDLDRNITRWKA